MRGVPQYDVKQHNGHRLVGHGVDEQACPVLRVLNGMRCTVLARSRGNVETRMSAHHLVALEGHGVAGGCVAHHPSKPPRENC